MSFSWPGPPGTWPLHVSPPPEQVDRQKSGAMQGPVRSICLCQAALHQMITERKLHPCMHNDLFYTRNHKARGECSQRPRSAVFAISSPTQRSSSRGATALQSPGTAAFKHCHQSSFKQTKNHILIFLPLHACELDSHRQYYHHTSPQVTSIQYK